MIVGSGMIPLLIPRCHRGNELLQQALPLLTSHFQIREIDESPTTPGDLVFPSLGIACLVIPQGGDLETIVLRARTILQRRRCLMLVPQEDIWNVQLRYRLPPDAKSRMTTEFDFGWGSLLGFNGSEELAEVIYTFVRGMTTEFKSV